jgi:hypothetical protein
MAVTVSRLLLLRLLEGNFYENSPHIAELHKVMKGASQNKMWLFITFCHMTRRVNECYSEEDSHIQHFK